MAQGFNGSCSFLFKVATGAKSAKRITGVGKTAIRVSLAARQVKKREWLLEKYMPNDEVNDGAFTNKIWGFVQYER